METNEIKVFKELTQYHKGRCSDYSNYVDSIFKSKIETIHDIPYLPVRAFKELDLLSVPENEVFKTMFSSGTTGKKSKIYLDKATAKAQSLHLAESFKTFFGGSRFPMLIVDSKATSRGQTARTAAVNGFSMYGKKRCFALDDNMELKLDEIREFLETHRGDKVFVFGFTFILYKYLIKKLESLNERLDLSNAFILHGGGWKKLVNLNISDADFKGVISHFTSCTSVHNYYGMIEQTGSVYFECEHGNLHAPHNGAVLIRNFKTFNVNDYGEEGLIQVLSSIQKSYPGHSLLTEDVGVSYPGSTCPCGNKGDILKISGRLELAEIRGCSDAV